MLDVASMASNCCGLDQLPGLGAGFLHALTLPSLHANSTNGADCQQPTTIASPPSIVENESDEQPIRTFLLADVKTGRRFVVPTDPSGGRAFNDTRKWCYRRGRFCLQGEEPDPNYLWTEDLQQAYETTTLAGEPSLSPASGVSPTSVVTPGSLQ